MKVMIVGGSTSSLWNFRGDLIRDIVAAGHEVVACASEEDSYNRVAALGARFLRTPFQRTSTNPFHDMRLEALYRRIFREEKPDVVLSYTIKPNVYAPRAARKAGVRCVYGMVEGLGNSFVGNGSLKRKIVGIVSSILYKRSLRFCDKLFFLNPDDLREFIGYGFIEKEQGALIDGIGVNMQHFTPTPLPETPVFLMISRLIREKGVMEYLEAARALRQRVPGVRCMLLGQYEPHADALREGDVEPYFCDGSVEYLGVTDDVRPYIARASTIVLPSFYREGTPRSLLEAMACGRAIITTDAPGCREVILPGKNGLIVPMKDAAALAQAMERIATESGLTLAMGEAGLRYCSERYDVRKVNRDIMRVMGL